jgi:hypothetical protein
MSAGRRPGPRRLAGIAWTLLAAAAGGARAQDEAGRPSIEADKEPKPPAYPNTTAGEFTPGAGFDLMKAEFGSLNVSLYGLARFLDQLPADQSFTDHLGRSRVVPVRRDINWHRTFAWLSGFLWRPALRYTVSIWSLPTTQQTLVFGNVRYRVGRALEIATGIGPNLGSRSMQGPWPYFLATDRQMADEFFRPGFTSSVWITGEPIERFFYTLSLGNNISQLGVPSSKDTRDLSTSASLWWMPTTGEFGPRGGFGDFEGHESVATRLGVSATRSREDRYNQVGEAPNNTQIRISDGLLLFEADALADGVTVQKATYALLAFDAGVKWRGFHLQTEYYLRRLSSFIATGTLPVTSIFDHGFYAQASQMVIDRRLAIYGAGSFVFDDFGRRPWEASGGANYFPTGTRSWRINLHFIYVDRSPAGSQFGYYVGGQTGPTWSLSTDFLL